MVVGGDQPCRLRAAHPARNATPIRSASGLGGLRQRSSSATGNETRNLPIEAKGAC